MGQASASVAWCFPSRRLRVFLDWEEAWSGRLEHGNRGVSWEARRMNSVSGRVPRQRVRSSSGYRRRQLRRFEGERRVLLISTLDLLGVQSGRNQHPWDSLSSCP